MPSGELSSGSYCPASIALQEDLSIIYPISAFQKEGSDSIPQPVFAFRHSTHTGDLWFRGSPCNHRQHNWWRGQRVHPSHFLLLYPYLFHPSKLVVISWHRCGLQLSVLLAKSLWKRTYLAFCSGELWKQTITDSLSSFIAQDFGLRRLLITDAEHTRPSIFDPVNEDQKLALPVAIPHLIGILPTARSARFANRCHLQKFSKKLPGYCFPTFAVAITTRPRVFITITIQSSHFFGSLLPAHILAHLQLVKLIALLFKRTRISLAAIYVLLAILSLGQRSIPTCGDSTLLSPQATVYIAISSPPPPMTPPSSPHLLCNHHQQNVYQPEKFVNHHYRLF